MKRFMIFLIVWIISIAMSFNIWKGVSSENMIKVVLATQIAYIVYRIITEEK